MEILLIDRFSHMLFEKGSEFFNRPTPHSRCDKHCRFGHVIEQEKCHAVALVWHFNTLLHNTLSTSSPRCLCFVHVYKVRGSKFAGPYWEITDWLLSQSECVNARYGPANPRPSARVLIATLSWFVVNEWMIEVYVRAHSYCLATGLWSEIKKCKTLFHFI